MNQWARFYYGFGRPGLHIYWGMIWRHSIFPDLSHVWCHTRAYFRSRSRFADSHFCMIVPCYEIHVGLRILFHFIMAPRWTFLGSFHQTHTFWCLCDFCMESSSSWSFASSISSEYMSGLLCIPIELLMGHHTGAYSHLGVHQIFCVLPHCSIYFLIFVSHHTEAYPLYRFSYHGHTPLSLGLLCLVLISWLSDPFADLYELSSCLGHPPTIILFRLPEPLFSQFSV